MKKLPLKLLKEYETLDAVYEHIDKIEPRYQKKLIAGRDLAFLSRDLATIRLDVDILLDVEKASTGHLDFKAVEKIFKELEFRTLTGRLRDLSNQSDKFGPKQQLSLFGDALEKIGSPPPTDIKTIIVDNEEKLIALKQKLEAASLISFDTETTGTDPMLASLVGISLAVEPEVGYYIPLGHNQAENQLAVEEVVNAIKPAMENKKIGKAGHNMKYDALVLSGVGIDIQPYSFDTMIAGWLIDPASFHLGLKDMSEQYLGLEMQHIELLIGSGKSQITMDQVSVQSAAPYAAADAAVPLSLIPLLQEQLNKRNAIKVFDEIEMPLVPVLAKMEQNGIILDLEFFKKMSKELTTRLLEIEKLVYTQVGYKFNLNSTQQLSIALFETLGLESPTKKKTSSGHFSTNAAVLESMQGSHSVVDLILEYRELAKLQSTYVSALPLQINPRTGRVHTSFSQTGSVTGRLASSNPNLQNIPTRTDIGRRVRSGFVSAPGSVLLSVDYSQIELRIVAHMSQDEAMIAAFKDGQDIHAATAAAVYGVPLGQVTKEQRRHAKAINFGLIYGMSAFGLSRSTGLTLAEAENFVKAYFNQFPRVKTYLDEIRQIATRQGYVETLLGRRRYFPNLATATNANVRNREEREAINAPIQGTAADILKIATIRLPVALTKAGLKAKLILQVHDELLLECPENEIVETVNLVQKVMEGAYQLSVKLATDARYGTDWGNMKPIELDS